MAYAPRYHEQQLVPSFECPLQSDLKTREEGLLLAGQRRPPGQPERLLSALLQRWQREAHRQHGVNLGLCIESIST